MSEQDDLKLLGALAREQEQSEREEEARLLEDAKRSLTDAQVDRFLDAAVPPTKVLPLKRRAPANVLVALGAAAAIAAGIAIYIQSRTTSAEPPRYAMVVTGGDQPVRGDGGPSNTISRGARVTIELRPDRAATEPIAAAAFLLREGDARTVTASVAVANTGAVRIDGARSELFGDAVGSWDLVVFVGAREALPRDAAAAKLARSATDPRVRVVATPLELLE